MQPMQDVENNHFCVMFLCLFSVGRSAFGKPGWISFLFSVVVLCFFSLFLCIFRNLRCLFVGVFSCVCFVYLLCHFVTQDCCRIGPCYACASSFKLGFWSNDNEYFSCVSSNSRLNVLAFVCLVKDSQKVFWWKPFLRTKGKNGHPSFFWYTGWGMCRCLNLTGDGFLVHLSTSQMPRGVLGCWKTCFGKRAHMAFHSSWFDLHVSKCGSP